jgi:hypothetical protein
MITNLTTPPRHVMTWIVSALSVASVSSTHMDSKVAGHRIRRAILMSIEGTHCTRVSIAGAGIPDSQAWKRLVYIGGGIFKACVTKRIYNRLINGSTAVLAVSKLHYISSKSHRNC